MARIIIPALATLALSMVPISPSAASSIKTLYSIKRPVDGYQPQSELISIGDTLYGTASAGGAAGNGAVFSVNPATGAETVLHSFNNRGDGSYPVAALINVGGTLYGTTEYGGANNAGTVFSLDPATGTETVLHSFGGSTDGGSPTAALINVGGTLYGTTRAGGATGNGTVFSLNPATGAETVVHAFSGGSDGAEPYAALISVGGTLYGTTSGGGADGYGTLFSLNAATGSETVLHSFTEENDGGDPVTALTSVGGILFGTTFYGGLQGTGAVFSFNPTTGVETALNSFKAHGSQSAGLSSLISIGNKLYGIRGGYTGKIFYATVFSLDPATGAETILSQSVGIGSMVNPFAALVNVGGTLYGTTAYGGAHSSGAVFSLDPTTGAAATVYSFAPPLRSSINALLPLNGNLILSTSDGGADEAGDIVTIQPGPATSTDIHDFSSVDSANGAFPEAALISIGGKLYGTTTDGGANGLGTVFKLNPATGTETVLHSFSGSSNGDGANPRAGLTIFGGILFGTTYYGGAKGGGTVFSLNPATGAETVRYSFIPYSSDGYLPQDSLKNVGGILYGTTLTGGTSGGGVVFSLNPMTGVETVLHNFTYADGAFPTAALITIAGTLYGTTSDLGSGRSGTLFSINPATGAYTVLHAFTGGGDGAFPGAGLTSVGGTIFGTTQQGGALGHGTVFSLNPATGTYTVRYNFKGGSDGAKPNTTLVKMGGALYGATSREGGYGLGTVFQLVP